MKLQVGTAYRTRDGRRVDIVGVTWDSIYKYADEIGEWYTEEGKLIADGLDDPGDIVAEWKYNTASILTELDDLAQCHGLTITFYVDNDNGIEVEFRK